MVGGPVLAGSPIPGVLRKPIGTEVLGSIGSTNSQLAGGPATANPVSGAGPVSRSGPWLAGGSAMSDIVAHASGQAGRVDLGLALDHRSSSATPSQLAGDRPLPILSASPV